MYWPVRGARISSNYQGGFRSTGGHSGIDLAAPSGTPIYAAVGGRVISVGKGGAYGNLVRVQHDDGSIGYYGHMSAFGIKRGARIERGTFIGRVGSTGNSTGPHLHFEVRRNGRPVNPMPWLEGSGSYGKATGSVPKGDSGGDETIQLPDQITYRDPNDVLGQLTEQGMRAGATAPAGGFAVQALDAAEIQRGDRQGRGSALGNMLNAEGQMIAQRKMEEQAALAFPGAMPGSQDLPEPFMGAGVASGAAGDFDRLMSAIRGKESGGNYGARNRHSGALGAYQIMPGNIASWSKAALGRSISASEFLSNPRLQDRIARHRLNLYYQKYGAAGAALAWYAGEGALRYSSAARNRKQGQYPSMNDYVRDVLRRAGL